MMVYILPHVYLPSKYLLWCMFSSFAYLKFVFMFLNYCVVKVLHIFQRKKLLLAMCSLNISSQFAVWLLIFISSVAQSCLTLCEPMNLSMPGLPVHHQLPESTQTHVHQVSDAIQPSHPLSSPSPPVLNLSQHRGLFQWVSSSVLVLYLMLVSSL